MAFWRINSIYSVYTCIKIYIYICVSQPFWHAADIYLIRDSSCLQSVAMVLQWCLKQSFLWSSVAVVLPNQTIVICSDWGVLVHNLFPLLCRLWPPHWCQWCRCWGTWSSADILGSFHTFGKEVTKLDTQQPSALNVCINYLVISKFWWTDDLFMVVRNGSSY